MDLAITFVTFAVSMAVCLACGRSMIWALFIGFVGFTWTAHRRGVASQDLFNMAWHGVKDSFIVGRVMLTIGLLTGLWRASGTFAILTAWGLQLIKPELFLFVAFLMSCLISYAIGTSFGTVGTIGVAMMTLARSGGVNEFAAAGAILSGIYFGDRASPASSCANLVAAITGTELYDNVRLMFKTALIPLLLSGAIYFVLSFSNPMLGTENAVLTSINLDFNLSPWSVLPAVIMLVLPLFKVNVFKTFLVSIVCAFVCAIVLQRMSVQDVLSCGLFGFQAPAGSMRAIFNGGGLFSMLEVCIVLAISGTFSGIFDGANLLEGMHERVEHWVNKIGAFPVAFIIGTVSNAIFCNQTVGILMSMPLLKRPWAHMGRSNTELAQDIANGGVMTAGVIPWCLGCSFPLATMGVNARAIPWAFYIYLVSLCYWLMRKRWFPRQEHLLFR